MPNDLETTLRIRPQLDEGAAAAMGEQIAQQVNRRVNQGLGSTSTGPGSGTVSTAAATMPGGPGATTTSTAGGAGAPPGASTTSTAGGGGGGPPGSLWTQEERWDMGRVNRVRADMSQYLSGSSLSSTARFLGAALGGGASSAVSAITTGMGDSVMAKARERAQQIEEARAMGQDGGSMGMLRFAGPFGTAASIAGGFIVSTIDKGLDLQEQTSQRYASMARTIAGGYRSGAMPLSFMRDAAEAQYGGNNADQQMQAINAIRGIGTKQDPADFLRTLRLGMTGASVEAITGYQGARAFGNRTTSLENAAGAIGAGQRGGLEGPGLDALLGQIASNTRSMAMRGIRVDAGDINRMLNRGTEAGIAPGIVAAGAAQMTSNVASLRDQALSPFKALGDAMVMQQALRGAGSYEQYVANLEGLAESPSAIARTIRPGGRLTGAAYAGTGLRGDLSQLPESSGAARPQYVDEGQSPEAINSRIGFGFSQALARTDVGKFADLQTLKAFEGMQRFAEMMNKGAMETGATINEAKAAIMKGIMDGNAPLQGSILGLVGRMEILIQQLERR